MRIIYTHRGFPVHVPDDTPSNTVFEAPEVRTIYRRRMQQDRPGFEEELGQVRQLASVWCVSGGMFKTILDSKTMVTPAVQSFVTEVALLLSGKVKRRLVSFQDLGFILTTDPAVDTRVPVFKDEERAAIEELAELGVESLIQKWVTTLGVDDLSQTMQLYVGA